MTWDSGSPASPSSTGTRDPGLHRRRAWQQNRQSVRTTSATGDISSLHTTCTRSPSQACWGRQAVMAPFDVRCPNAPQPTDADTLARLDPGPSMPPCTVCQPFTQRCSRQKLLHVPSSHVSILRARDQRSDSRAGRESRGSFHRCKIASLCEDSQTSPSFVSARTSRRVQSACAPHAQATAHLL